MKFLCLAYYDAKKFAALTDADRDAITRECPRYDALLIATGGLVLHGSLAAPGNAIAVRPRGGKALVTDGPYAETKEQVGGFFLIEAADRADAIRLASMHPAAHLGESVGWGIEIRERPYFKQFTGAAS